VFIAEQKGEGGRKKKKGGEGVLFRYHLQPPGREGKREGIGLECELAPGGKKKKEKGKKGKRQTGLMRSPVVHRFQKREKKKKRGGKTTIGWGEGRKEEGRMTFRRLRRLVDTRKKKGSSNRQAGNPERKKEKEKGGPSRRSGATKKKKDCEIIAKKRKGGKEIHPAASALHYGEGKKKKHGPRRVGVGEGE